MTWRMVVALAGLAVACGTSAVIAQSNPIQARQALMKANGRNAGVVARMVKGQDPFDPAKVDAAFAQWAETAQKLPELFPDDSKTGDKTRAAPKIWQAKADFDAKAAAFGKVVADNHDSAKASLDGLKVAVAAVGKACGNCHEDYRLPEQ
jgi:cytochrome c556